MNYHLLLFGFLLVLIVFQFYPFFVVQMVSQWTILPLYIFFLCFFILFPFSFYIAIFLSPSLSLSLSSMIILSLYLRIASILLSLSPPLSLSSCPFVNFCSSFSFSPYYSLPLSLLHLIFLCITLILVPSFTINTFVCPFSSSQSFISSLYLNILPLNVYCTHFTIYPSSFSLIYSWHHISSSFPLSSLLILFAES